MDKDKIHAFWSARTSIEDARIATNFRDDGRLSYDVEFVGRYLPVGASVLDLGAGTCTLALQLLRHANRIVAVEKYAAFLEKAPDHPRLVKVCSDVADFTSKERFDVVLMFGVINYLTVEEEKNVYRSCQSFIGDDGVLLVKSQCGVNEAQTVDSYSSELQAHYYARYPAVGDQERLLSEFFAVDVCDVYPAKLNRWDNTHFYAFICRSFDASAGPAT